MPHLIAYGHYHKCPLILICVGILYFSVSLSDFVRLINLVIELIEKCKLTFRTNCTD